MSSDSAVDIAIEFVEQLNRRDFGGLVDLMASDFQLFPGGEEVISGREKARDALAGYVSSWPDFQIHVSDVHLIENVVVIVGRTTGSCEQVPKGDEIRQRRLYVAKVENGLVTEFRHLPEDTDAIRKELGMSSDTRITE